MKRSHYLFLVIFGLLIAFLLSWRPEKEEPLTFIQVKDSKVHYKKSGVGEAVILLHGGYLNLDSWTPQISPLKEAGFEVIRFSDLGHGESEAGTEKVLGYEIVRTLMDSLFIQKAHLVGLSWGAVIAVDFALEHPERTRKLVLVSPGLNGWEYFQDSLAAENLIARQIAVQQRDTITAASLFHQNWVIGPYRKESELADTFVNQSFEIIYQTFHKHWEENWSEMSEPAARTRLPEITAPTLLVEGTADVKDIHQVCAIYRDSLKNARLVQLPGAHSLPMEMPQEFNALMIEFLKE